jgi:exopolysaccharide biosynthesis WecB/TagA/CpsF family protein
LGGGACEYHSAANGQVIAEWRKSEGLSIALREADVISADSMPMVFASKFFGSLQLPERVATSDLFFDVAERAQAIGLSFYLLGGDERTNRRAAGKLADLYPALNIAGRRNGFFGKDEESDVVDAINAAAPDILWVGMGVPRQEQFAAANRRRLTNVGVLKTCGGCFRYLSGELQRAPEWLQRSGLEWAYLASLDPRNRLMRYVRTNPMAVYRVVRESDFRPLRPTSQRSTAS